AVACQSSVAIDSVCGARGTADFVAAEQSRTCAQLGMARSFVEVSDPVLCAHIVGRPHPLADRFTDNTVKLAGCNEPGESDVCRVSRLSAGDAAGATGRQRCSCVSMRHLGMWILRHQLFVVDTLAAYERCRARRLAGES